jgi:hypothetical protein
MCLFICANPAVRHWLQQPVDHAHRKAMELKPLLAADLLEADDIGDESSVCVHVCVRRVAAKPRVVKRAMVVQITPSRATPWRASSELEKPLKALAHAWTRFLAWLGRRR